MKYKGHYLPSDLLSPVSYTWHDITLCSPLLDENKFCSFSELATRDGKAAIAEELDTNNVLVLCMGRQMTYRLVPLYFYDLLLCSQWKVPKKSLKHELFLT